MNRFLSWVLTLALTLGVASTSLAAQGVAKVDLWPEDYLAETYPILSLTTERSAGRPVTQNAEFTVHSGAKLTVENHGVYELLVTVNGRTLVLNPHLRSGDTTLSFDLSPYITYGAENSLTVVSRSKPGGTATLTVEAPVLEARFLYMNDIHGKIDPLPKAAAYIKAAQAAGEHVYFINGGDIFSGNPVSDLNHGKPMIEVLNAMDQHLMAVGNHEFDHGPESFEARRAESTFPWLSANTEVLAPEATAIQPFEPYMITETKYGHRIAFIGLTETPPSTARKNIVGLGFTDPAEVTQQYIDLLRDSVNLVVVVSHNGYAFDRTMAQKLSGADLIIGGHSHTLLNEPVWVNGIPIVQAGADGLYVGDIVLTQVADELTVSGGTETGGYIVNTARLTTEDSQVKAIVHNWNEQMSEYLDGKIGSTPIMLDRGERYSMDVSIGNVITDAMAAYMNAEIALTNNGGLRADIPAGDITMRDIYTVLPFGNFIQKWELTGAQLQQVITHSYTRDNRFQIDLQTSGLTYTIYTKPGSRELDRLEMKVNGEPLDLNRVYTVAVADYIGTGGGGYPLPAFGSPLDQSSDVDAIVVGEYVAQIGDLNYAFTEGRIRIEETKGDAVPDTGL